MIPVCTILLTGPIWKARSSQCTPKSIPRTPVAMRMTSGNRSGATRLAVPADARAAAPVRCARSKIWLTETMGAEHLSNASDNDGLILARMAVMITESVSDPQPCDDSALGRLTVSQYL